MGSQIRIPISPLHNLITLLPMLKRDRTSKQKILSLKSEISPIPSQPNLIRIKTKTNLQPKTIIYNITRPD